MQLGRAAQPPRRIEDDAQERRQHRLADPLREGLRIVGASLAVALHAMAEDLVEEHARRRARTGSPAPRTDRRSAPAAAARAGRSSTGPRRAARTRRAGRRRSREEAAVERQLHAVGSLGRRLDHDAAEQLAGGDARPLAVGVVAVRRFDRERDVAAEDQRIVAERRREPAQPLLPGAGIDGVRRRWLGVDLRLFAREVRCGIVGLDLRGGVGARAGERLGGLPVGAIGPAPQLQADRRVGVGQRQVDARDARARALPSPRSGCVLSKE